MEGLIVEMDMFHLRWLRWWMDFSENHCQALSYVLTGHFLCCCCCYLTCSVVSPKHDKFLHRSSVASQGLTAYWSLRLSWNDLTFWNISWQVVWLAGMFTVSIDLFEVSSFIYYPETPTESMHYSKLWPKNNELCWCDKSISKLSGRS